MWVIFPAKLDFAEYFLDTRPSGRVSSFPQRTMRAEPHEKDFTMIAPITAPVTTIKPTGTLPPWITPTFPNEPKPWERNCWDPTKWGTAATAPAGDRQAVDGAAAIG